MSRFLILTAIIILLCAQGVSPSSAHDLWIEDTDRGLTLYRGHRHSSHAGEEFIEYDPGSILSILCFDRSGSVSAIDSTASYPLRICPQGNDCSTVFVLFSSGFWTKTPYGTKNIPKTDAKHPLESCVSYENVKYISIWNEEFLNPLTEYLELAPLHDPFSLDVGDKLRLQATMNRRPAENIVVTYDGKPRGVTGEDGRINIRLRYPGLQLIQATLKQPLDSEDADTEIHTTGLCFYIGGKP